uniref:Uncharacterized protein n=1 Tax=Anguilla anguilla TaxID=7936 RepID=A0A0E9RL44_ANGAN
MSPPCSSGQRAPREPTVKEIGPHHATITIIIMYPVLYSLYIPFRKISKSFTVNEETQNPNHLKIHNSHLCYTWQFSVRMLTMHQLRWQ